MIDVYFGRSLVYVQGGRKAESLRHDLLISSKSTYTSKSLSIHPIE